MLFRSMREAIATKNGKKLRALADAVENIPDAEENIIGQKCAFLNHVKSPQDPVRALLLAICYGFSETQVREFTTEELIQKLAKKKLEVDRRTVERICLELSIRRKGAKMGRRKGSKNRLPKNSGNSCKRAP